MPEIGVIEKIEEEIQVQVPKMYKVILHNDDTTTFDFVIAVLTQIFHRPLQTAIEITADVHVNGQGIAGAPYTREVAEEKTTETISFAKANGFSLVVTFEEL
jgi:ATP-dependent Clp protease adaptor protein ClpS